MSIFPAGPPAPPVVDPTAPAAVKVFGREPAVLLGVISSVLALASLLILHWSTDQLAVVMAFVVAGLDFYVAWATRDTLLSVATGLIKAAVILLAGFGLDLDPATVTAVILVMNAIFSAFVRTQTSPVAFPPAPVVVAPVAA